MNETQDFGMGPVTVPAGKEYTKDPTTKEDLIRNHGILVVGTNNLGEHAGGAARYACQQLGLPWGQAEGIGGLACGLVTLNFGRTKEHELAGAKLELEPEELLASFNRFKQTALDNKDKKFYLTKVGLGIARYTLADIHKAFWDSAIPFECENVVYPIEFEAPNDMFH